MLRGRVAGSHLLGDIKNESHCSVFQSFDEAGAPLLLALRSVQKRYRSLSSERFAERAKSLPGF